ncbi:MAG: YcaO-like family protein [Pseudomonadota bacterium]
MTKIPLFLLDARRMPGGCIELPPKVGGNKSLCLRMLETVIHSCPACFMVVFSAQESTDPDWMRLWGAAAGRGLDRESAEIAAQCEAVERVCLISQGASDPRLSTLEALDKPPIEAKLLWKFSASQMHNHSANMQSIARLGCGWRVDKRWLHGRHWLNGSSVALPATATLFHEERFLGLPPILSSSSGAAVRDTPERAADHAVMELMERDGVAIWWYNKLVPARLSAARSAAALPQPLGTWLGERQRLIWHLALPSDLPVPTVVALSAVPDGTQPAIGAAAALHIDDAITSATLEMLQCEIALTHMRQAQAADDPPAPPPLLTWSDDTNALTTAYLAGTAGDPVDADTDMGTLKRVLTERGIDIYIADLTLPAFGAPVVRAVSPQLRDWLPRFAPGRLYDVPVALGLRGSAMDEADLNPVPFVI